MADTVKVYTVDYPPFQIFNEHKGRTGFSIELLETAARLADIKVQYVDLPWARAQRVVENEPGSVILTLAKTSERLKRYTWVATIYQVKDGLYSLANRNDIAIDSIDDVYQYSVALPVGDVSLQKLSISPDHNDLLFMVNSQEDAINMLVKGRADLNHNNDIGFFTATDRLGLPRKMFRVAYVTNQSDMGIATSKTTDPELVKKFQVSINEMRRNGQYDSLRQKWFSH